MQSILREAEETQAKVNAFNGCKTDKEYIYLEEMLTRLLIKLDNIESEGKDEIRNVRRQAVKTVQSSIDQLELKAFANEQPEPPAASGEPMNSHQDEAEGSDMREMVMDSEMNC